MVSVIYSHPHPPPPSTSTVHQKQQAHSQVALFLYQVASNVYCIVRILQNPNCPSTAEYVKRSDFAKTRRKKTICHNKNKMMHFPESFITLQHMNTKLNCLSLVCCDWYRLANVFGRYLSQLSCLSGQNRTRELLLASHVCPWATAQSMAYGKKLGGDEGFNFNFSFLAFLHLLISIIWRLIRKKQLQWMIELEELHNKSSVLLDVFLGFVSHIHHNH